MNLIDSVPEDEPAAISRFDLNFPKISIDSIASMSVMKNPVPLLEAQKRKSWMKTNPDVEPYRAWDELTYVGGASLPGRYHCQRGKEIVPAE